MTTRSRNSKSKCKERNKQVRYIPYHTIVECSAASQSCFNHSQSYNLVTCDVLDEATWEGGGGSTFQGGAG
jgi:hypothetical protein